MAERVVLDLVANIDPIKEALAKLPPEMRKHASGAVRELEKELRKAEKTANVVAAKTTHAFRETGESAEGVKRIFDAVGGEAGTLAGQVEHVVRSMSTLSTTIGTAAGAATALTLGIGALGTAVIAAALNTSELVKQLEDSGDAVPITRQQLQDVKDMDRSIQLLTREFKEFAIMLGADVAPAISSAIARFREGRKVALDWAYTARAVGTLGSSVVWEWLSENIGDVTDAFWKNSDAIESTNDNMSDLFDLYDGIIVSAEAAEEKSKRLAKARKEESDANQKAAAAARALEQLRRMERASLLASLDGAEKINATYDDKVQKIQEQYEVSGDLAAAEAAWDTARLERAAMLAEFDQKRVADAHALYEAQAAAMAKEEEARRRAVREKWAAHDEQVAAEKQAMIDSKNMAWQTAQNTIEAARYSAETVTDLLAQGNDKQKAAARVAFAISKAAAIAQSVISTYLAIQNTLATGGPYPYNIINAAAVGVTGAANTAIIATQQPNFANGGVMDADHRPAMLQPGEGVLTRAGVNNVGGSDGIAAINQGRQGGSGPMQAYVVFDHRWFDRGARQNIQRGGAIGRAINRRTRPVGQKEYSR